jgi:ABC-type glycerol-3-phosphate transport system substrate-binding protein
VSLKKLFAISAIGLSLTGLLTYFSYPNKNRTTPVLYWVTDANPVRQQQVEGFHQWQIEQGHTSELGGPRVQLKIDSANRDLSKMIIQGVSGVGGDILDFHPHLAVRYFEKMGLLCDLSDDAKSHGFDQSQTFKSIAPELVVPSTDGRERQFAYPCNVTISLFWLNRSLFNKYGIDLPGSDWSWDDFEKLGLRFREASLAAGDGKVFVAPRPELMNMIRSHGLSIYNETASVCQLDSPQ